MIQMLFEFFMFKFFLNVSNRKYIKLKSHNISENKNFKTEKGIF